MRTDTEWPPNAQAYKQLSPYQFLENLIFLFNKNNYPITRSHVDKWILKYQNNISIGVSTTITPNLMF